MITGGRMITGQEARCSAVPRAGTRQPKYAHKGCRSSTPRSSILKGHNGAHWTACGRERRREEARRARRAQRA